MERERTATVNTDVVAALEAEAASLSQQLLATEGDAEGLLPLERELTEAEEALRDEAAEVELRFAEEGRACPNGRKGHCGPEVRSGAGRGLGVA